MNVENIPLELKEMKQWGVYELLPPKNGEVGLHKLVKIPIDVKTGKGASSSNSDTWSDYDLSEYVLETDLLKYKGLAFFLGNGVYCFDIDNIEESIYDFRIKKQRDNNFVYRMISEFDFSYTEVSQSGTGIHIFFKVDGEIPTDIRNRNENYEMYYRNRFIAMTGDCIEETGDIKTIELETWKAIYETYINTAEFKVYPQKDYQGETYFSKEEIKEKMFRSQPYTKKLFNGDISEYPSHSEADLALCSSLAFWTNKDVEMMNEIFIESGLSRDKWNEKRGAMTYGERTLHKAILGTKNSYAPWEGELYKNGLE